MTEKDELAIFVFGKIVDFLRSEGLVVRNPMAEYVTFWIEGKQDSITKQKHKMSISVRDDQYEAILSSIRENEQRERKRRS